MGKKAMVKLARKTNPRIINLILDLKQIGQENEAPIWMTIADKLERPSRNYAGVNLSKINRHAKEDDVLLVPGKVLGAGDIKIPVTVAALGFSSSAIEKITNAGGKCVMIEDMVYENPEGTGIRIFM
ncbi:MAG: 50S ribosomal protein L18e [Methanosarcinaceae archaeon]|nr:50S ribosomal protein L18e [Methanosarcinaceae archaeon]